MINMTVIGRAERIQLLDHGVSFTPAKVDTGADVSSIWASQIKEEGGSLQFVLFAEGSQYYTGEVIRIAAPNYRLARVANSFGAKEMRYIVKLRVLLHGRKLKASFTLADRSSKIYPILIGRRLLTKKFIVDVSRGEPLDEEERKKLRKLHVALEVNED
jgi:hypothetical protein